MDEAAAATFRYKINNVDQREPKGGWQLVVVLRGPGKTFLKI